MQDELRKATLEYLAKYQTPIKCLARKIPCSDGHLHHFLKGNRNLGTEKTLSLWNIIKQ